MIGGYSASESLADEFQVLIANGDCGPPVSIRPHEEAGIIWNGEPEAITRLLIGFGSELPQVLIEQLSVPEDQVPAILEVLRTSLEQHLVHAAMPIQDAIDLAEFLVDLTIKVSRFREGTPTVGGEIEIAVVTKHEGFKWVWPRDKATRPRAPRQSVSPTQRSAYFALPSVQIFPDRFR